MVQENKEKLLDSTYKRSQSLTQYVEEINSIAWLYDNLNQKLPSVASLLNHAHFRPCINTAYEYDDLTTEVLNLANCKCTYESLVLMVEQLKFIDGNLSENLR